MAPTDRLRSVDYTPHDGGAGGYEPELEDVGLEPSLLGGTAAVASGSLRAAGGARVANSGGELPDFSSSADYDADVGDESLDFSGILDTLLVADADGSEDEGEPPDRTAGAPASHLAPPPQYRRHPTFAEFRDEVLKFVGGAGSECVAELRLLQLARRRDLSGEDCDALIKTITDPSFVASAYGRGTSSHLPTCWRSFMNHARALMQRLRRFIPEVAVKDCMVSTGPGTDAHEHCGRVAYLVGSATWAFMLLDVELFQAATLVRPIASAGQSAVTGAHPSWADNVGAGGAPHPSFAAQSLARESTVRARFAGSALRVVPFGVFTSIDGTKAGTTVGRASLTPIYARSAWLSFKRLHEERAYSMIAVSQIRKLTHAARSNTDVASVLRAALVQELLRASLCCEERFEPFVTVLPGETESVLLVPYLMGIVLDWGEVVVVCACGGGGKGCNRCTCMYGRLGDPVVEGYCAGGGTFRDGKATATWAAEREAAGTMYAPVSRADMMLYRSKPVRVSAVCWCLLAQPFTDFLSFQLAVSEPVILRTLPTREVAAAHGMRLPSTLREFMLFFPDLFHNLEEGEIKKARERLKTLLFNWCRARSNTKAGARAAYDDALDAVDRWGAAFRPYARLGRRTMTQYHQGWTAATALFGWDHVNMLSMLPMLLGFNDVVLPRRLKRRVVQATEAIQEVYHLSYLHGKDAAACLERKLATIRYEHPSCNALFALAFCVAVLAECLPCWI